MMTARIIPFPAVRIVDAVERIAWRISHLSQDEADDLLRSELRAIRDRLDRVGVERALIGRELTDFEHAVRAALGRELKSGGRA